MINYPFASDSPKSSHGYQNFECDLESGTLNRLRKSQSSPFYPIKYLKSIRNRISCYCKLHPTMMSIAVMITILIVVCLYKAYIHLPNNSTKFGMDTNSYQFVELQNLVMVATHSVYTSTSCEEVDKEDSWFLLPYQKHEGQASTFVEHIKNGVEIASKDDQALLLFSGGETRKEAGPRSEAQSYWMVAESQAWFGNEEKVRRRAITEEHARDSFENLLFSICRFRELTGKYPQNITVVGYDFKKERFVNLHRAAIRFPVTRFFYSGSPATLTSRESALKGESVVRTQFQADPYGCIGSLQHKRLGRDPFYRTIPYPSGCPEMKSLFGYCQKGPYPGTLPWT